jgi:flagellin
MASSVERLSSGLRVNRAKDDAAGLGIATSLSSQINGSNQGIRNLNDGISIVQTAEGAIGAAIEMGQRILTLATQGANETLGSSERNSIQNEMRQLITAIDSISSRTNFTANTPLFMNATNGTTTITLQASNVSSDIITLAAGAFIKLGTNGEASSGASSAATIGQAAALNSAINAAASALTTAQMNTIRTTATTFLTNLTTQRSLLGAFQNQIEYSVSNLTELSSNLSVARSNIVDTDYATETASLTKGQILQQAATAMLAQANQMPNVILSLLK